MCVLTAEADIDALLEEKVAVIRKEVVLVTEDLYAKEQRMRKLTESLKDENALLKNQVMHLAAQQRQDNVSLIAFSVVSHENFDTTGSNIQYPVTYINIGGGWHNQTHSFQAPVAGVYYFTASCRAAENAPDTFVRMIHTTATDQTVVASLFAYGENDVKTGDANSVILQLGALDYVSVRLDTGALKSHPNDVYSTFSGFLLLQL